MKNLLMVLAVMLSTVVVAQDTWKDATGGESQEQVYIKGVGYVWVDGVWSIVALNRNYEAFEEVMEAAVEVLTANGIRFDSQEGTQSDFPFTDLRKRKGVYYKIVTGGTVRICWVISNDDGVAVLAFLHLSSIGFRFEVGPRYLD